jgi:hypothetical protein
MGVRHAVAGRRNRCWNPDTHPGYLAPLPPKRRIRAGPSCVLGGNAAGLDQIWHLHSRPLMALLRLVVLATYAALTTTLALRAFSCTTLR